MEYLKDTETVNQYKQTGHSKIMKKSTKLAENARGKTINRMQSK